MNVTDHRDSLLPESLQQALLRFRRRLWSVKLLEALAAIVISLLFGFLLTFMLDRFHDTPAWLRGIILLVATISLLTIPITIRRWIIRRRRFDQLASLLAETDPPTGDPLLGVVELADKHLDSDQSRSPVLVRAAIDQVADQISRKDLSDGIPDPKHRSRAKIAASLALITVVLFLSAGAAATNAWSRLLAPWSSTPRYTFAHVQPLPENLVVAKDEPFQVKVALKDETRWRPKSALATLANQSPRRAKLNGHDYEFRMPGQISPASLSIRVGDYSAVIAIDPRTRPELSSLVANIQLPAYLQRHPPESDESFVEAVRGSKLTVLDGSQVALTATASRALGSANIDGRPRPIDIDRFDSESIFIDQPTTMILDWQDIDGLSGREAFQLNIEPIADTPPIVRCEDLPSRKMLLDSEVVQFKVRATDDYGIKRVGIQWRVIDEEHPASKSGETFIGVGNPYAEDLELIATFRASDHKIDSAKIALRVFAEDYFPSRERSYSSESEFDVLSSDEHAIWITDQLSRWQQMSLDARDRELQLHETNKQLRALSAEQLSLPVNQKRLARQAELERSGGNQLSSLARDGESLLSEAMRNREIGADHLNRWAEMVQTLQDIANQQMPSIAELLEQASQAASTSAPQAPTSAAGQNRLKSQANSPAGDRKSDDAPKAPTISDVESSQNDLSASAGGDPSKSESAQARLTLPNTMLASPPKKESSPKIGGPDSTAKVGQAVKEQQDLLAEFDKIADDLNEVLANLEGSTLVKRLKAASRRQQQVAARLAGMAAQAFGVSERKKQQNATSFQQLAEAELRSSRLASHIMDDMDAYFRRSRLSAFGRVLQQMRDANVTAELRLLSDELRKENGLSIAQAEYWSDTLDRWAEDLVPASESGEAPGGKSKGSLPPSVVLEVLQLLAGEVDLREQTRFVEQSRPALTSTAYVESTDQLWQNQAELQQRTDKLIAQVRALPEGDANFAKEIGLLSDVASVMTESVEILRRPDTGSDAIAAETEIIEKLLEAKRFSPSGGGGGAAPGGGGKGETKTPALALVGSGINAQETREEMSAVQSTGVSGTSLPAEYRSGLDQYFQQLETWRSRQP